MGSGARCFWTSTQIDFFLGNLEPKFLGSMDVRLPRATFSLYSTITVMMRVTWNIAQVDRYTPRGKSLGWYRLRR